jgi:hypothetical protein
MFDKVGRTKTKKKNGIKLHPYSNVESVSRPLDHDIERLHRNREATIETHLVIRTLICSLRAILSRG